MNRSNNSATPDTSGCSDVPKSSNNNNQPKLASSKKIINKIVLDVTKLKEAGLDRRIAEVLSRQRARNTKSTTVPPSNTQHSTETSDASTTEGATPITKSKDMKTTIYNSKMQGSANVLPHQTQCRNLVMPKITITKPADSPPHSTAHAAQLEHMDSKQRLAHAKMLLRRNLTLKRDQANPNNQLTVPKASAGAGASNASKPERASASTKSHPVILNFLNNKQREWQKSIKTLSKSKDDQSGELKQRPCPITTGALRFAQKPATATATADGQCSSPIVLENKVLSAAEKIDLSALRLSTYLKAEEDGTKVKQLNRKSENSLTTQTCGDADKALDKVAPKPTKIILSAAKLKRSPAEIAALAKQIQTKIHASNKGSGVGGGAAGGETMTKPLFKWKALKTVLKPMVEQSKVVADAEKPAAHVTSVVGGALADNHLPGTQDAIEKTDLMKTDSISPKATQTNSLSAQTEIETELHENIVSPTNASSQVPESKKVEDFNEASIVYQPPPAKKEKKHQPTAEGKAPLDAQSSIMSAVDFIAALTAEHPITESTEMEISPEELNLNATFDMNASPLNISDTAPQEKDKVDGEALQAADVSGDISIGKIWPLKDVAILDATMDDIEHNILCIRSPNELKTQNEEHFDMPTSAGAIAEAFVENELVARSEVEVSDLPVAEIVEQKEEAPILTTNEKDKKNANNPEVAKRTMRSKKGKINLVQRVKKPGNTKKQVNAAEATSAHCVPENSFSTVLPQDDQDKCANADNSIENTPEESNKQSASMAASNVVEAEANEAAELPKGQETVAESEPQSSTDIVESNVNADKSESAKDCAEEVTNMLLKATHNVEPPDNGPPQIPFKAVTNTEEELRTEPPIGINNLLNHKLLLDTTKINESPAATKESKPETKLENRPNRKKIVKARPVLNAKRVAKKASSDKEDKPVPEEKVKSLPEAVSPIVESQEIEVDAAKQREVGVIEDKQDSTDMSESKTNDDCCVPAINQEETNKIDECEITKGNLAANEKVEEDDAMKISIERETIVDHTSIEPETNKEKASSIEENEVIEEELKEVDKKETKSKQEVEDADMEVNLRLECANNKESTEAEQKEQSSANTKNVETADEDGVVKESSVEKNQACGAQTEMALESVAQVQVQNDSCDNETANDESSQDEILALSERKRLRKTLMEHGKKSKPLPPTDSEDDNSVNDFYGFDEDSATNTEIQNNLSALNATTKSMKDQATSKTSTIQNWLTTGKAIVPTPQVLDAATTVGRGVPPKKRREFVKTPSNETDITDDASPVDDDNIELNPLEESTVSASDPSSNTAQRTSEQELDKPVVADAKETTQENHEGVEVGTTVKESKRLNEEDLAKDTDLAKKESGGRNKKSKAKVKRESDDLNGNEKPNNANPSKKRKRVSSKDSNLSLKVETPKEEELPKKRSRRRKSKEEQISQDDIKIAPTENARQKRKSLTVTKSKDDLKVADTTTKSNKRSRKSVNENALLASEANVSHQKKTPTSKKHKDNQPSGSNDTQLEETSTFPAPKRRRKIKCESELVESEATPKAEPAEISHAVAVVSKKRDSKSSDAASVANFNSRLLLIRKREDLNTDKVLTVSDGVGPMQCGLCLARTTKAAWLEHQATHYGVGWLAGEQPLNVSSRSAVLATMINFFRTTSIKGLKCRLCDRVYRSSLGLLQHLEVCGEVQQRVECSFCKRSYTKFSIITHERACAARSVDKKVEEASALPDENDSAAVAFSNSGRRKRVSTIKAETKLKRIGKELTVQGDAELLSFDAKEYIRHQPIPNLVALQAQWSEELKNSKQAVCPEKLCSFQSDDLVALEQHVSACSLMPKPGYHCKACVAIFSSQKKALKHVRQRHKPQADFDGDVSDYDAKGDKESSDEYESSGVDSNEDEDELTNEEHSDFEKRKTAKARTKTSINSADNLIFPGRQKDLEKVMSKKWQTFIDKNYAKVSLFNFAVPTFQTIEMSQVEKCLPKPQPSVNFCYANKTDMPINFGTSLTQREWSRLALYESTHEKDEHITYIGAAVRQLGWVPLPAEVKEQYLVCSYRKFEQYTRHANPKIGANVILVLKFMAASDAPNWQLDGSVHYGIHIQDGPVQCFSLLPSGGCDVAANRLGLLAVGCAEPDIKIYALPLVLPENNQSGITILDLPPAMILTFDLKPQNMENKLFSELQCTQICWDESQNHNLIVAGFGNGCIGIWDADDNEDENLNRFIMDDGVRHFVPLHFFYFGEKNIRFLALHYGVEGARWLAVATSTRKYGVYDIRNLVSPQLVCGDVSMYVTSCLDWSPMWETLSIGCSDLLLKSGTRVFSINPTGICFSHSLLDVSQSTPRTAHYSPELLLQAMANDNGDVIVLKARELNLETTFHKVTTNQRAVSMLDVQTLSGAESVEQTEIKHFTADETQFREKYGILFRPLIKVPLDKKAQYQHVKRRPPANLLSHMRVNAVRFNCNKSTRNWLAVGCENGFLRIINFKREAYFGSS